MNLPLNSERRRHTRDENVSPCKVRDRRGLLYASGQTTNISESGALIRVDRSRPFATGDQLDIAIATGSAAIVSSTQLKRATVRRVTPIDFHHQAIAIQFDHSDAELAAA